MYRIAKDFPDDIILSTAETCISLYQPTHRFAPENQKDVIVFKHLLQQIEDSLEPNLSKEDVKSTMEPLHALKEDAPFWQNTMDGLAVLVTQDDCVVYLLNAPVESAAIVAENFHLKPLIHYFQSAQPYHLLGLSSMCFSLYEGNRYGIKELEIDADILRSMEEVLGEEHPEGFLTHGRYGGSDGIATFHGHGGRKDAIDKDIEKFFRYVDRIVLEHYSKPMKLPLILVSLTEHQSMFRKISNNPYLVPDGVEVSYESTHVSELAAKAWELMEPVYQKKELESMDRYQNAKSNHTGSDRLIDVARAAFEGRIATLLLEADKSIPGRFNTESGKLEFGSTDNPERGDLIDQIVNAVWKHKGEVIVLPTDRMPGETGLAAIFRF
ncbi:MAG TPA: hypothetical protein VN538_12460 [Clostridia bacterium]|nr:hypothetical protein [Clostridia bacterium]